MNRDDHAVTLSEAISASCQTGGVFYSLDDRAGGYKIWSSINITQENPLADDAPEDDERYSSRAVC